MKKVLLLLIGAAAIVSCNSTGTSSGSDSSKTDSSAKVTKKGGDAPAQNWVYATDTDKMSSKVGHEATVSATNKLQFEFPYEGGSTGEVMLRNENNKNEILLLIDKGRFVCATGDGCEVVVRFDQNKAIKFTAFGPSDGSSKVLFLHPAAKFIAQAKAAKKMIVQAEFYESGLKEMEFNIDGLKWTY